MKEKLNELALFAGAGGGILGGHLLGWRTVCAVEWEPYAACVLAARQNDKVLPPFPIWDDVQTFDGNRGEELLTLYLAGFPAKPIPQRLLEKIQRTTFGRKCDESWQMSLPGTFLPKTSAELLSTKQQMTVNRWVIKPKQFPYQRKTWVLTTFGKDFGYLHTPTTMANYCAPSMQKHAGCRTWKQVFGKVTPNHQEWLMGWPLGWTDLKPLEMDSFQSWQRHHGKF